MRPSIDDSWLGLDTLPGITICAKLYSKGTLEGGRRRGHQKKTWVDWTSHLMDELLPAANTRSYWQRISMSSSFLSSQRSDWLKG
ncbi:hypothetical protein DPMN_074702 [Dreissena polymorpha]|uniref:Uncharacterized protein n=1 Tax=Dreissena polymorpha TaxID=45954 RepID=A0A9D3YJ01_DREPO|nr:hypothetical protein DPMN_074702 [Dreissena polymorpha]